MPTILSRNIPPVITAGNVIEEILCVSDKSIPPPISFPFPLLPLQNLFFYFKPKETIISIIVYFSLNSKVDFAKEEE